MMATAQDGSERSRLVSLSDEEGVKEILATTIMSLWEVVNDLTRLRPSRRERYRVAIFGSARAEPGSFVYEEVKRAAAAFAALGCDIVTGGGPGLMQAANEGATSAVVVPGGIGTVLEMLMIWQLLQVRHVDNVPLILVGKMWKGLVEWASTSMLDPRLRLASPEDMTIPRCLETADEAIVVVREQHAKWQAQQPTAI
jgi:predicted Rossmann-fold nucleotide-binding protein